MWIKPASDEAEGGAKLELRFPDPRPAGRAAGAELSFRRPASEPLCKTTARVAATLSKVKGGAKKQRGRPAAAGWTMKVLGRDGLPIDEVGTTCGEAFAVCRGISLSRPGDATPTRHAIRLNTPRILSVWVPSLALCGLQAPCTITAEHADAIEVSMAGMAPQMVVARDEAGRFTVLLTPTVGHAGVPLTCTCVPVCGQVRGELVRA